MEIDVLANEYLDNDAISKYKMSATIANRVTEQLVQMCLPGASIVDLCNFGDEYLQEQLLSVYNKSQVEKGVAFPVCMSVNEVAVNCSPLPDDSTILKMGDVVKITLGAQIDGYIALSGHTHIIGPGPTPVTGRAADAVCAAYYAAEAIRLTLRPGVKSDQLTNIIERVAHQFHCVPVVNVYSYNQKRFIFEGDRTFVNRYADEIKPQVFEVQPDDVFNIDVQISTGDGKLRQADTRTTVFRRNLLKRYQLKLQSSRVAYAEITERFPSMPFCARGLDSTQSRVAIKECVEHELLIPYPVLTERKGQFVAQQKFTALVRTSGTERLTFHAPPYVHSDFNITDPELKTLLGL